MGRKAFWPPWSRPRLWAWSRTTRLVITHSFIDCAPFIPIGTALVVPVQWYHPQFAGAGSRGLEGARGRLRVPQESVNNPRLDPVGPEPRAAVHGPLSHPDSSSLPVHLSRSSCCPPPPGRPRGLPLPKKPLSDPQVLDGWGEAGSQAVPVPLPSDWVVNLFRPKLTNSHRQTNASIAMDPFDGSGSHRAAGSPAPGTNRKVPRIFFFFCAHTCAKGPASPLPCDPGVGPHFQCRLPGILYHAWRRVKETSRGTRGPGYVSPCPVFVATSPFLPPPALPPSSHLPSSSSFLPASFFPSISLKTIPVSRSYFDR